MSVELSPERQFDAERSRNRVKQYIAREILPKIVGCYDADDEEIESKNS